MSSGEAGSGSGSTGAVVVMVTAPSEAVAADIASALVRAGLAACATLVPGVRSVYVWEGKLCDDAEVQLLVKTRAELVARVEAKVRELHPYKVPEIIALPVVAGSAPYLQWIAETTAKAAPAH
eukprot:m51a1_g5990 hypothetical protein (123) ;mRNA; r:277096-277464